jgi:NADPH:quinone reductase-like Zn-dependent oxidoreductase
MRAIVLMGYGDVDNLELKEVPDPKPRPNEIKVAVAAASVNPIDWKIRSGAKGMVSAGLPVILGRDVAGHVVEVGSEVTTFKVGDRVMGLVTEGYADFVAAPTDAWAIVPAAIDLVDAAALPLILLTGAELVEEAVKPSEGETVLVTGAVGSVGRAAVFAAKELGAKVWAGVRRNQEGAAREIGAAGVVAMDEDAAVAELPKLDSIADTVGGTTLEKLYGKLKSGGVIGSVLGEPKGAKERGFVVHALLAHPASRRLGELGKAVADRRLQIPIAKRFPLALFAEAQKMAEKGAGGKVVITF